MKPLNARPNLTDQVYQAILEEILEGALTPGEHLVQEQLAEDLGVSRQPIQQAMVLLKADGLVEEVGKRGLTVIPLDLARMAHHYDIRAELDAYGARMAAAAVRDSTGAQAFDKEAEAILTAGAAAAENGTLREQTRLDEAFHRLVYLHSGNPVLDATAAPNWRFLRRAMAEVLRHAEPPREIWEQHREIAEAIRWGDESLADNLARLHVRLAAERLTEAMEGMAP